MDRSFDFGALLHKHEKIHKSYKPRPTQFVIVSDGLRIRREVTKKRRRSSRLTIFDTIRSLQSIDSPKKQHDSLKKVDHRRIQLEKWKEEKNKKKQQAAAEKKKPFVAGVAHAPLTFIPPPKLPSKALPSTSGRVTRSQTAQLKSIQTKPIKASQPKAPKPSSFAPKDATFKAPAVNNLTKVPNLVFHPKIRINKEITFDPILPTSEVKNKIQAKYTEIKRTVLDKNAKTEATIQTHRGPVKAGSSSSCHSQNFSENMSMPKVHLPITKSTSKCTISSTEQMSPPVPRKSLPKTRVNIVASRPTESKPLKSKTSSSGMSNHSFNDKLSVSEQPLPKSKPPNKSTHITRKSKKSSTSKSSIPKSESSSEEKLRSPKSPVDLPKTPEQIVENAMKNSPFVTLSRGKANARRETKRKIEEGLFEEDASSADSVEHFRRQLNSEIKRMTEMCQVWETISEQIVLPDTVQEAVLGAVGQARLLMSHKLQQFASLVARCERPEPGQALVTPADLHGFWDMVFMQVENVDMRFKKLEEMRARNWVEEAPAVTAAPRGKTAPKSKPIAKPAASSRLRDLIAAARKAKKEDAKASESETAAAESPAEAAKTFDAGFFCVQSPVRSPVTPAGAVRPSLLKTVLSSEAKKSATKNATSLAILRASLIGKSVENDTSLDNPTPLPTPVNLQATPGRSILKPLNKSSTKKSAKKSIKVVLFNDSEAQDTTEADAECNNFNGVQELDVNTNGDTSLIVDESSVDFKIENKQKENKKSKRKSVIRQDAVDISPIRTRRQRNSEIALRLPLEENVTEKPIIRTSRRKNVLQEFEVNIIEEKKHTPRRSSRSISVLEG